MQVSNDGGFIGAAWESFTTTKAWQITSHGDFVIPRTVYVRFQDASGATVPSTFRDDIILDETPPTGSVSIPASGASSTGRTDSPTQTVRLTAADDLSSVAQIQMRLSNRSDFAGALWQPFAATTPWDFTGGGTIYAQFRDGAGNASQVYSQSLTGSIAAGHESLDIVFSAPAGCRERSPCEWHTGCHALDHWLGQRPACGPIRYVRQCECRCRRPAQPNVAVCRPIRPGQEPTSLQFTVRRQVNRQGQATTIRLVVFDGSGGEWSTFVGGGPNAF